MRKRPMFSLFSAIFVLGLAQLGLPTTAAAMEHPCRWQVNFVKYEVTGTGGERTAEIVVTVSVTGDTVRHPKRGFKRVSQGDTVSVGEQVKRVAVAGRQTFRVALQAREIDAAGPSGSLLNESVTMSCDRDTSSGKNRTETYNMESDALSVRITVAYRRV